MSRGVSAIKKEEGRIKKAGEQSHPIRRGSVSCSLAICACLAVSITLAAGQSGAPVHYYDAAIGKTGAALKSALQGIIRGQTVIPYTATGTDTWDALKVLDQDPLNASNVVLVYSGFTALKSDQYNGQTGSWDREHLWPQSFGITALNGNSQAKSDLFNLRPINPGINSSRGNKYYDVSTAPFSTYPNAPGSSADSNSWEPRDADKGTISRALFYMAVRYDGSDADVPDLELSETPNAATYRFGKLSTVLRWNRQFAVESPERQRNEIIYMNYQHNRNPFIDHSDYAEMVFLGVTAEQAWRDTNFTDAELATPAVGGDNGDPDLDGMGNLLEYVFASDPWVAGPEPVSETLATVGSSHSIVLSYVHNRNATDATVSYEWSADLLSWSAVTPVLVSDVITSSEAEVVTVRFPLSATGYSVRIRATGI